jgi:hypothetical protein
MDINKLIEEVTLLGGISKPVLASLNECSTEKFYVDVFGNSNGLPTVSISVDEPLPEVKKSDILLEEIIRWKEESIHYLPDASVYLISNYEYDDESYDIRYFKLRCVIEEKSSLILISEPSECIELREYYEAFNDNMFAED